MENNNKNNVSAGVHLNTLNYFSMGNTHIYAFLNTVYLNTFPMGERPGFLAVSKGYDEYFVGMGSSRTNALYDWKSKFHYYFQLFERGGTRTEEEDALYERMTDILDVPVYKANSTVVKAVEGTIAGCRLGDRCPCSYKLKGSPDIYQLPNYSEVDPSFLMLKRNERFRGVFEYNPQDYKLKKILFAEKIN